MFAPAAEVAGLKRWLFAEHAEHRDELSAVVSAVGYEVEYLLDASVEVEHVLGVGIVQGGEERCGERFVPSGDGRERGLRVVGDDRGLEDFSPDAVAPSMEDAGDVEERFVDRAQSEWKGPSKLTFVEGGRRFEGAGVAPNLVLGEAANDWEVTIFHGAALKMCDGLYGRSLCW